MGCDIHTVIQKPDDNGVWQTAIKGICSDRNYTLFGVLSGVRGLTSETIDGPIMKEGLPDDFDKDELQYAEHSFGHVYGNDIYELWLKIISSRGVEQDISALGASGDYKISITLRDGFVSEEDREAYEFLNSMIYIFGEGFYEPYRLVVGYDS